MFIDRRGHRKRPGPMPGSGGGGAVTPGQQSQSKRIRHVLSEEQKKALNTMYEANPKPMRLEMCSKGEELGLPTSTVVNWFHNQRAKANRLKVEASLSESQELMNESQDSMEDMKENDKAKEDGHSETEPEESSLIMEEKNTSVKSADGVTTEDQSVEEL